MLRKVGKGRVFFPGARTMDVREDRKATKEIVELEKKEGVKRKPLKFKL